jgi:hypothetical protein
VPLTLKVAAGAGLAANMTEAITINPLRARVWFAAREGTRLGSLRFFMILGNSED